MVSSVIHDELDFKWLAPLFSWLGVASYFGLNIVPLPLLRFDSFDICAEKFRRPGGREVGENEIED